MTRKQLTDPFGSDDEEDHAANVPSSPQKQTTPPPSSVVRSDSSSQIRRDSQVPSLISVTSPVVTENPIITPSKSEDLKERARKLLEQTKREAANNASSSPSKTLAKQGSQEEDERQQQLRERARKLIAEARQGLVASTPGSTPGESATAPASTVGNGLANRKSSSRSHSQSPSPSPTESIQKFLSKNRKSQTPDRERSPASAAAEFARRDTSHYIANELETLETEQRKIDQQAAVVERKLRRLMETGPASSPNAESEEQLMQQWFTLVNKKNALIRRQMQLNILEKEDDLERRFVLLDQELRNILAIEDWQKTEAQKLREKLLLEELVAIVDKRNELVQHQHQQEKAIEEDDMIQRAVHNADLSNHDRNCILQ